MIICATAVYATSITTWDLAGLSLLYVDVGAATTTYRVQIIFRVDGTVDVLRLIGSDLNNEVNPYVDPTSQTSNTWVRCTHVSGSDMTAGATRGVWLNCGTQRIFEMSHTSLGGTDELIGRFNFELASDSGGASIEATKNSVDVEVGELF